MSENTHSLAVDVGNAPALSGRFAYRKNYHDELFRHFLAQKSLSHRSDVAHYLFMRRGGIVYSGGVGAKRRRSGSIPWSGCRSNLDHSRTADATPGNGGGAAFPLVFRFRTTAGSGGVGGGGIYNFTSKSGTNTYHGSGYSYIENTFLNAGISFTNDGTGKHVKVVKHLADYGGTIGGPVLIPRLYNGKNKTFFFFNLERYRDREALYAGITTVPTQAYLTGDLSNNLLVTANRNIGTDFAGRAIIQNAIYDPATSVTDSTGRRVLNI
ncbi:MAG: hypothetical protein WCP07_08385, partial [bacterium]